MNKNEFVTPSDILNQINLFQKDDNHITNVWKKVVSKIKKNGVEDEEEARALGEKLASNSNVVDLKNGILLVETNHPGWIQYLQFYEKFILNGLKWAVPDLNITSLAYRVAGSRASLSKTYENQIKKEASDYNKKVEETQRKLEQLQKTEEIADKPKGGLPPELNARFDRLINSMLTNSKE